MMLLAAPVLGLIFFSADLVYEKSVIVSDLDNVELVAELAVKASSMVHETQKERGMTAGFLGSKGKKFATKLPAQRKNVDSKKYELEKYLKTFERENFSEGFNKQLDVSLGLLEKLDATRKQVSAQTISTANAIGYYTKINGAFLELIGTMTFLTSNAEVARHIAAYENFLLGKERAGIERAVLANTFARNKFGPGMFRKFGTLVSEQETYVHVFETLATKEAIELFEKKMHDPAVEKVNQFRTIAFAKANTGDFGVDANVWFNTITKKINILKQMEDWLSEDLISSVHTLDVEAWVSKIFFAILGTVITVLSLFFAFTISRNITTTLNQTVSALKDIAEGEGDLTRRLNESGRDEIAQVAIAFNKFSGKIENMVADIKSSANSINISSNEIATGNLDLSQRTEEQASSLEETASSMEEMTSTVKQNADNARQANQLAMSTREGAEKGGNVLHKAVDAMGEISSSSKEIADIIGVIDEIAFQTNLLALNAAVEAARAGEQGRGFAVVASEVRTLAGRSADAAKEIKELINDSVQKVELGSNLVDESGKTLEEIVNGVKKVTDIIAEIAASSQEQANGIEQVNSAVMQMDEMTQQNAALVEEASAASVSMTEQSQALSQMVAQFKVTEVRGAVSSSPTKTVKSAAKPAAKPVQVKREAKVVKAEETTSAPSKASEEKVMRKPVARAATKATSSIDDDSEWDEF